jgi:hypothetical protein
LTVTGDADRNLAIEKLLGELAGGLLFNPPGSVDTRGWLNNSPADKDSL